MAKTKKKTTSKATSTKKKTTTASKKTTAKTTKTLCPIRRTLTKSALLNNFAEHNDISRKQCSEVLSSLENVMRGSVNPRGASMFIFPGLIKETRSHVC